MRSSDYKPKGIVLAIVACLLATLGFIAASLAISARLQIRRSSASLDKVQAEQLAQGALAVAMQALETDQRDVDYLGEPWALVERFSPESADRSLSTWLGSAWTVKVKVIDEAGKIDINAAPVDVLANLKVFDSAIIASILDWADPDDVPNPDGAEDNFYSQLPKPYPCKNAPFEQVEELLLIKGISAGLFFGTEEQDLAKGSQDMGGLLFKTPLDPFEGLGQILTVHRTQRINANTAPAQVLQAIPYLQSETVEEILRIRSGPDGQERTADDEPFKTMEDLLALPGLTEAEKITLLAVASFSSNNFTVQIYVERSDKAFRRWYKADLARNEQTVKVLSWRECTLPVW